MASDDRRHQMEEKTYAVFTAESINAMAESAGISSIPHDAAVALGEDVSYRMRQVIMLATQYMKHSKRRRLSVEDFNQAAKQLSVMPVHGHGSQESTSFRHLKEIDMHCVEDPEVNLSDVALGSYVPKQIGQPSIKAHWLAVEGVIKISSGGSSSSQGKGGKEMSSTHLKYYNCMTKALLGSNPEAKKKALQDLKTNSNLVPVLPYLINFVVSGIKNMSHDIGHLTTLLNTVRALLHNKSLYLMHKPYLSTLVQGVEFCVLEPLAASINSVNDHWVLRDYAARLLAEIVNRWSSVQNHLPTNTVKNLKEVLYDTLRPFYSHYGAIMTLIALGQKSIENVILPHLPTYWPHLKAAMEDLSAENVVSRSDSHKVYGALRLAAEKVMRKQIQKFKDLSAAIQEREEVPELIDINDNMKDQSVGPGVGASSSDSEDNNVYKLYANLYEYFGDSLAHCLPLTETHHVFKPTKKEQMVSLGDHNSGKSGEELLDNLMEQIRLQEKAEQERKERELLEQKEREKRERERRARQAIEQKKREDEERKKRLKREEEELRRRKYENEEAETQKRLREEAEKRQREWDDRIKELNRNRSKPEWQQKIELRQLQLEEEMQYSRMMEAKKRQEGIDKAKFEEEEKRRKEKEVQEELRQQEEEDELAGRSRVGLRRRKPVNYTEKDEDISDLFDEGNAKKAKLAKTIGFPPRLNSTLPPHSDISDDSDGDLSRRIAAGHLSPASAEAIAVSKVIDPSKGLLKLKIKRQATHSSTPPHPLSTTPQHTPSSYHSPSMLSPMYSPHSTSHSTPPPPTIGTSYPRSKSSSGSEKESKQKKGSTSSKHSRAGSTGIQDISDPEEPFFDALEVESSIPPMLYSPGPESSGSDTNHPHRALKLKLKLTPKDSASE